MIDIQYKKLVFTIYFTVSITITSGMAIVSPFTQGSSGNVNGVNLSLTVVESKGS